MATQGLEILKPLRQKLVEVKYPDISTCSEPALHHLLFRPGPERTALLMWVLFSINSQYEECLRGIKDSKRDSKLEALVQSIPGDFPKSDKTIMGQSSAKEQAKLWMYLLDCIMLPKVTEEKYKDVCSLLREIPFNPHLQAVVTKRVNVLPGNAKLELEGKRKICYNANALLELMHTCEEQLQNLDTELAEIEEKNEISCSINPEELPVLSNKVSQLLENFKILYDCNLPSKVESTNTDDFSYEFGKTCEKLNKNLDYVLQLLKDVKEANDLLGSMQVKQERFPSLGEAIGVCSDHVMDILKLTKNDSSV